MKNTSSKLQDFKFLFDISFAQFKHVKTSYFNQFPLRTLIHTYIFSQTH